MPCQFFSLRDEMWMGIGFLSCGNMILATCHDIKKRNILISVSSTANAPGIQPLHIHGKKIMKFNIDTPIIATFEYQVLFGA